MSHSGVTGDSNPVATHPEWRMRADMENAPTGKELLLINEGGKFVTGVLSSANRNHFVEWQLVPKRALKNN